MLISHQEPLMHHRISQSIDTRRLSAFSLPVSTTWSPASNTQGHFLTPEDLKALEFGSIPTRIPNRLI